VGDVSRFGSLAYLEMCMVLARMSWKYDLSWFNAEDVDWERDTKGYTVWEKPPLRCEFRERQWVGREKRNDREKRWTLVVPSSRLGGGCSAQCR